MYTATTALDPHLTADPLFHISAVHLLAKINNYFYSAQSDYEPITELEWQTC